MGRVEKLWNGDSGSMKPKGSVLSRHRQYSLYRVSASRVLHQFAWGGFLWCCWRPRQIGDFFTDRIPKLFLGLILRPFVTEEDLLVQLLPTIPMTLLSRPHSFPQSPWPEFSLLEGDFRALGQPMSSILELGINLAHLNCTLQPYHFQAFVA